MIKKGRLIEIENVIYYNENMIIKIFLRGNCIQNCEVGEETEIKTITGYVAKGAVSKNKTFYYNMNKFYKDSKEILMIRETKS